VELALLDLKLNTSKTVTLRIGNFFRADCITLSVQNDKINWSNEAKYLGVHNVQSRTTFSCCFNKTKTKFYRTVNAILGKTGKLDGVTTTMHLLSSIALPMLAFAFEALSLNKTLLNSLNHPWKMTFMKVFKIFDIYSH